tara:strand:+ start:311 stop:811 length:501 start_codon:yes stop_codon:yes gene_type:complete
MFILKPEMAQELKQTTSKIYTDSPTFLRNSDFIATIGDICTIKLIEDNYIPNLMIMDYKTKRDIKLTKQQLNVIEKIRCKSVKVVNEPGTISRELYSAIEESMMVKERIKIIVEGEEDLATLPVIKHSKMGAKVIYGMPDKGMVVVDVNQRAKERANKLLKKMLVK